MASLLSLVSVWLFDSENNTIGFTSTANIKVLTYHHVKQWFKIIFNHKVNISKRLVCTMKYWAQNREKEHDSGTGIRMKKIQDLLLKEENMQTLGLGFSMCKTAEIRTIIFYSHWRSQPFWYMHHTWKYIIISINVSCYCTKYFQYYFLLYSKCPTT